MLNYQDIGQLSLRPSEERIDSASRILGSRVVARLLAFALYLLGARRRELADCVGMSRDTVKSVLQRVLQDGLPALEDRRRSCSTFRPAGATPTIEAKVLVNEESLTVRLAEGSQIEIPQANPIQSRTVLLTMLESKLLNVGQVADATGLSTERVRKLKKKLLEGDVHALIDRRVGQPRDYRVTPDVKAELIQQFVLNVQTNSGTSSERLGEDLKERCEIQLAPRTIRLHLAKLGLGRIRESLPELLGALKKTPGGDRTG